MSPIDDSKLLDRAVDLLLKQDDIIQSWVGRYIAVQSGIAVAAGVIINWKGTAPRWSVTAVLALLGVLAIVFAFLLNAVINRHLAWQRGFIGSIKEIEGHEPKLFRKGMVDDEGGTRLSVFFNRTRWVLGGAWLAFIVVVVAVESCSGSG